MPNTHKWRTKVRMCWDWKDRILSYGFKIRIWKITVNLAALNPLIIAKSFIIDKAGKMLLKFQYLYMPKNGSSPALCKLGFDERSERLKRMFFNLCYFYSYLIVRLWRCCCMKMQNKRTKSYLRIHKVRRVARKDLELKECIYFY
jgi:hypothetical protein